LIVFVTIVVGHRMESAAPKPPSDAATNETASLRSLSPQQWKSGIAAWLGWMFDGLELHLYTFIAAPFVAELLGGLSTKDDRVARCSSIIQGAFLLGWAIGGGFFGRIGDRIGRARALSLTILTYAAFTGLSFFATQWWHLMIFRFLAALGVGGEWAVGASLLSETWPKKWRPWIAAVLQCGVNIGILFAVLASHIMAGQKPKYLFLVGVLPALMVFWIRRAVPEPAEWHAAKAESKGATPGVVELFRGNVRRITIWVVLVCGISLTAHWAFMFWYAQHLRNLPEVINWDAAEKTRLVNYAFFTVIGSSIAGNFLSGWLAKRFGYRATIGIMFLGYFLSMFGAYYMVRDYHGLFIWFPFIGLFQGVFGLFTMYLPPLFPTLLRTTGAGFCYNIGRAIAAVTVVLVGPLSSQGDYRPTLLFAGALFVPAAFICMFLPRDKD
jgi:MFS family permease